MKYPKLIALSLAGICAYVVSGHATTIVDDTWADNNRTSSGTDGAGIDSQWFGSGASLSDPAAGDMHATIGSGSAFLTTYFAAEGSEVTLANPGDQLSFTFVFTPSNIVANVSQAFNFAVANTPTGARTSTDASPASGVYAGYSMFMNLSSPNLGNASPFALREWVVGSGALLGTSGNWGANGTANANLANAGLAGNPGYTSLQQYTFTMTLKLDTVTNGTLDIISTMTGPGLNGNGFLSDTNFDATPNSLAFDTFALRPSGSGSGASAIDISHFKVDFTPAPTPEPSTIALAVLGAAGLFWNSRRRR